MPLELVNVNEDLVRQIVHVDHSLRDAGVRKLVEDVIEQGAPSHTHQRLRHLICQWAHPQPEAGGEYHRFGGSDGHLEFSATPLVGYTNIARDSCRAPVWPK